MQENQYDLKQIADLLKWQYDYCTKLDNFLIYNARGYRSMFAVEPTKQPWFSRGFIEQTILNLNQFWKGAGRDIELTTRKPYVEFIDNIARADTWLTTFVDNFNSENNEAIRDATMRLDIVERKMVEILISINPLLIAAESAHIQRLSIDKAGSIVRDRLATIARDRAINRTVSRLHEKHRDMENDVYSALKEFINAEEARIGQKAIQEAKASLQTVINNITTTGNGNAINTGNNANVIATINQQSVGQGVTAESVAEEIRQLTAQIRELLERESMYEDTKGDVTHQLATVDRQMGKETPNFTVAGKALGVVETLLTDALSSQTAPVILAGIQQVIGHINVLMQ